MRELVAVMAVRPQRHEGTLVPHEPRRCAVAGPLGDLRQGQADRAEPFGQAGVRIVHQDDSGISHAATLLPLTTLRPEGRGSRPSRAGVPVSQPTAPWKTRSV